MILDIGGGIRPQEIFPGHTVVLEPCAEYRAWLCANRPDIEVIAGEWADVNDFEPESYDHVTLLDVVEHVDKPTALDLLEATKAIARISVVVFTPLGYESLEPGPDGLDAWGMHGGEYQRHVSGWHPRDFPGWDVRVDSEPHWCIWAQWTRRVDEQA